MKYKYPVTINGESFKIDIRNGQATWGTSRVIAFTLDEDELFILKEDIEKAIQKVVKREITGWWNSMRDDVEYMIKEEQTDG